MTESNIQVHATDVSLRLKCCDRILSLPIKWDITEIGHNLDRLYLEIYHLHNKAISSSGHAVLDCNVASHTLKLDGIEEISARNDLEYLIVIYGLTNLGSDQKFCFHTICSGKRNVDLCYIDDANLQAPITLSKDLNYTYTIQDSHKTFNISMLHYPPSAYGISHDNGSTSVITIIRRPSPLQTLVFLQMIADDFDVLFDLTPATDYTIWMFTVENLHQKHNVIYRRTGSSSIDTYRTYMTVRELKVLYDKAVGSMRKKEFAFLEYFYRNKPVKYYDDIFENHCGIMKPYVKDDNGDRSSIINRNIEGLFFSAFVDRKLKPSYMSYFGRRRVFIRSDFLFHDNSNLYFADFYCHYEKHYVTLILTEKDSKTDNFCTDRLLHLNRFDNPFLKLIKYLDKSKVFATLGLPVEVIYTEPLDLNNIRDKQSGFLFKDVPVLGRGSSKPSGIPKNQNCKVCNL